MNKMELVAKLSERASLPKAKVEEIIEGVLDAITAALKADQEVTLSGFGTFSAKLRKARTGVNPQKPTEKIQIPAMRVPKFKAGKTLKDALKS